MTEATFRNTDRLYGNYVVGKWKGPGAAGTFAVRDPATGELVAEVATASADDVRRAIDGAAEVQPTWGTTPPVERAAIIRRACAIMTSRLDELGRLLVREQGKPLQQAIGEIVYGIGFLEWFAEEGRRAHGLTIPATTTSKRILVLKQPIGVTAAITPWNFPSTQLLRKLGAALAAGCTMVAKPAELTPLSALEIARAFDEAGLPPGVLSILCAPEPYEFADVIMNDPRVRAISFTGSTEVGKILMRSSADTMKRVSLELGGHAPLIVFDDADLDAAVAETMASKFRNMGQTCVSVNRIFVQEGVLDEFRERLEHAMSTLVMGNGLDDRTDVGPLIEPAALDKVERHVTDAVAKGAKLLLGGSRASGSDLHSDQYFEPTLLTNVDDSMLVTQEETFGPVAPILSFADEAEVIERANNTPYGLSAYCFTNDLNRAIRMSEGLDYGTVGINDAMISAVQAPFGGMKESGLGREGGPLGMDEYLETKYVSIGQVG
jgi:succinate-semialdehyde dehydrogenase / glutarate-semialdehyde dehydrogenase